MALCSECGEELACPHHGSHAVSSVVSECPLNKKGVIWVEVVDDQGLPIDGVQITGTGGSGSTSGGFAQMAPVAAGSAYTAKITGVLPVGVKDTHALPLAPEQTGIVVSNGQIKLVTFKLRAIANPLIAIDKKVVAVKGARRTLQLTAHKPFSGKGTLSFSSGGDKIKLWRNAGALSLVGNKIEFAGIDESGVSLEVEALDFSAIDGIAMKWELASDTVPTGPAAEDKMTAVKATLDLHKKSGTALTATEKSGDGLVILLQDSAASRARAKLVVKCEPADYQGTLVLTALIDNVKLFDAATAGSEKAPLPLSLAVGSGALAPLYVEGKTVSAAKSDSGFKLSIKDLADDVDLAKLTVLDARIDLYHPRTSPTTAPALMTAAEKKDPGRLLVKQNAAFERERAKLVVVKLPKDAPCKLKLKASGAKAKLFPAANEKHIDAEAAETLPKTWAAADIADDAGVVYWAEGATVSSLREVEYQLEVEDVEDACDKALISVVDLCAENGTDPAPRFMPNKNLVNTPGNHHITKVKLVHNLGAGTLAWSSTSTTFALSNQTTDTVTLTSAEAPSSGLDAETLAVVFTPTGKPALPAIAHKMAVVKVVFSESPNQSYGYDDMDDAARATADLHHVNVKKNGSTKIKVKIEGATSEWVSFKSMDGAKAEAVKPASGASDFDLVIDGKNQDAAQVVLHARVNGDAGAICESINVHVYKEKVVNVTVARVHDSTSASTALQLPFDATATETAIRAWYKLAVAVINLTDGGLVDVNYDLNANGKLDLIAGASSSTESALAAGGVPGGGLKVVIVRELAWLYMLGANATAGDTTITIGGAGNMSFIVDGETYPVGVGATLEDVTVLSKAGRVVTLAAPLTHNHTTTESLQWPLSGLSGNPIWVQESGKDVAMLRRTIGHEVGHSALVLLDVVQNTNLMHFSAGRIDTKLRWKALPRKYNIGTTEAQWDTCNRS